MRWSPARRGAECEEWLDADVASEAEVVECYREIDSVNRWLGGFRATFEPLAGVVTGRRAPRSVLDVAGGDGAFAHRFQEMVGRDGRVIVVDRNPATLRILRRRDRSAIGGDARRLPFADRAFDLVHAACFFHHLSIGDACDALAEMCRVSRRFVLVNDLVRAYPAWVAIHLLTATVGRSRIVRHDAPLSVRKALLPRELRAIARSVSARPAGEGYRWAIARTRPYRMTLVGARVERE